MVHTAKAVKVQPQAVQVVVQEVEQVAVELVVKVMQVVMVSGLHLVEAVAVQQALVAMVKAT